jgi:hypothetical protein
MLIVQPINLNPHIYGAQYANGTGVVPKIHHHMQMLIVMIQLPMLLITLAKLMKIQQCVQILIIMIRLHLIIK